MNFSITNKPKPTVGMVALISLVFSAGCIERMPWQPPPQSQIEPIPSYPPPGFKILTNGQRFSFARGVWRCDSTYSSRELALESAWSFYRYSEKIRIEENQVWYEVEQ